MNLREWMKVKWGFLSRLPNEEPSNPHLPFLREDSTDLHISNVDSLSQEVKAIKLNESHRPSDTLSIAKQQGFDSSLNGEKLNSNKDC